MPEIAGIAMNEVQLIRSAFAWRGRPERATNSSELTSDELQSLMAVFALDWRDTTATIWDRYSEAVSYFSPEAFCYYLPGIMLAAMEEGSANNSAASSVIWALDRSPRIDWWDEQFSLRWPLLTLIELSAVEAWIVWLSSITRSNHDDVSLGRAMDTLQLLRDLKPPIE